MSQTDPPMTINLGNICNGAAVELFELSIKKVMANIADPNTSPTKKRQITLTIELAPHEDRIQVDTKIQCAERLAGVMPAGSRIYVGKDEKGNLYALTADPRQANLFTPPGAKEMPKPLEFKNNA